MSSSPCQNFLIDITSSDVTICKNCGFKKFQHFQQQQSSSPNQQGKPNFQAMRDMFNKPAPQPSTQIYGRASALPKTTVPAYSQSMQFGQPAQSTNQPQSQQQQQGKLDWNSPIEEERGQKKRVSVMVMGKVSFDEKKKQAELQDKFEQEQQQQSVQPKIVQEVKTENIQEKELVIEKVESQEFELKKELEEEPKILPTIQQETQIQEIKEIERDNQLKEQYKIEKIKLLEQIKILENQKFALEDKCEMLSEQIFNLNQKVESFNQTKEELAQSALLINQLTTELQDNENYKLKYEALTDKHKDTLTIVTEKENEINNLNLQIEQLQKQSEPNETQQLLEIQQQYQQLQELYNQTANERDFLLKLLLKVNKYQIAKTINQYRKSINSNNYSLHNNSKCLN